MKKQLYTGVILVASLVAQENLLHAISKVMHIESDAAFNDALKDTSKIKVIDFYTDWCGVCKTSGPHFEEIAEEDGRSDVIYLKVNTDQAAQASAAHEVQALPTFVVLGKDNVEAHRQRGAGQKASLKKMIDSGIDAAKSGKKMPEPERRRIDAGEAYGQPVVERRQLPGGPAPLAPSNGQQANKPKPSTQPIQNKPADKEVGGEHAIMFVDTPDEYASVVLASAIPTVIHFSIKDCKACAAVDVVLEALSVELKGKVQFVDIEVDNESLRGITGKAGLLALPNHDWLWTDMSRDFSKKDESALRSKVNALANQRNSMESRADKKAKQKFNQR